MGRIKGDWRWALSFNRLCLPLALAAIAVALYGCSHAKDGHYYEHVSDKDAGMNAAIEKAKGTRNEFIRAYHEHKEGTREFAVKKPYSTPAGEQEHMWIQVTEEKDGVLKGIVAN